MHFHKDVLNVKILNVKIWRTLLKASVRNWCWRPFPEHLYVRSAVAKKMVASTQPSICTIVFPLGASRGVPCFDQGYLECPDNHSWQRSGLHGRVSGARRQAGPDYSELFLDTTWRFEHPASEIKDVDEVRPCE